METLTLLDFDRDFEVLTREEGLRICHPSQVRVDEACANCDRTFTVAGRSRQSYLFCSEPCKQIAKDVRWARRHVATGTIGRPEIAEWLRTRRAFILSGGYPARARRISPALRDQAIARSGGECQLCGQPFRYAPDAGDRPLTIQHMRGSSNDLRDLPAFCSRCNTLDVQSRMRPETNPEKLAQAHAFERRYLQAAHSPIR